MAGIEVEISSADAATIQTQLAQLYTNLSQGIDAQIAATQQSSPNSAAQPRSGNSPATQTSQPHSVNGNGNHVVAGSIPQMSPVPQPTTPARNGYAVGRNRVAATNNGNGRRVNATEAQCRAIFAICKAQGVDMLSVLADFNVGDPKDLHVKDASRVIDLLKNGSNTATQQ